eukprot:3556204-Rhodomonas_salina.5
MAVARDALCDERGHVVRRGHMPKIVMSREQATGLRRKKESDDAECRRAPLSAEVSAEGSLRWESRSVMWPCAQCGLARCGSDIGVGVKGREAGLSSG